MISSGEGIRVIQGTLNDKEVCIKYYKSEKRDIGYEISIYEYLDTLGVNLPWYSTEFYVLDHKVLVIEKLEKLSSHDDEYQMAHDIVSQLRKVKCRGVHSDIKPSNIMKKEGQYTLIDFGGFTREKLEHGYRRWVWTEQWTSQRMHEKKQITTPKHDLVELCFSIKHIQNLKSGKKSDDKNTKSGFSGRLLKFHERVMKINPKHVKDEDYLDLLDILNIA
jgi:serine/threonine protein kinase